jgi:hypothetical protein
MARPQLTPARMEAFSDGVIAVIITIMVLEIHVPGREVSNAAAIRQILPLLLVYLLSFIQAGIYWVNHHYLVDDLDDVTHGILWPTSPYSSASRSSLRQPIGSVCAASVHFPSRCRAPPARRRACPGWCFPS